jgi:uncharacterized protein YecT (DUF1311 family)
MRAAAADDGASAVDVIVRGRIIGRRRVSKRLAFYDVRVDDALDAAAVGADDATLRDDGRRARAHAALSAGELIEMVVKASHGAFVTHEDVAWAQKTSLKLGNAGAFRGTLSRRAENAHGEWSLACQEVVEIVEEWAKVHPGKAFQREFYLPNERGESGIDGEASSRVADGASVGACKFFINNGFCAKGDKCKYAHDRAVQREWIAARKANRREIAAKECGDPHGDSVASKQMRAQRFAQFLLEKFGAEVLNAGTGVLDVAGGRGDVSFELHTKLGIKSTLVEPRERKLNKQQHKWLKKKLKTTDESTAPEAESMLCEQIRTEFSSENFAQFKDCSAIIGMHPDQATEAIVDFALQYSKPFAVVPCCVFPDLFKHRRDRDGAPVTERMALVDYLARKTGGEVQYLDIEGANQVVYGVPK